MRTTIGYGLTQPGRLMHVARYKRAGDLGLVERQVVCAGLRSTVTAGRGPGWRPPYPTTDGLARLLDSDPLPCARCRAWLDSPAASK